MPHTFNTPREVFEFIDEVRHGHSPLRADTLGKIVIGIRYANGNQWIDADWSRVGSLEFVIQHHNTTSLLIQARAKFFIDQSDQLLHVFGSQQAVNNSIYDQVLQSTCI